MDSSAFELVIVPVCQGLGFGLIFGHAIHQVLRWISVQVDSPASPVE